MNHEHPQTKTLAERHDEAQLANIDATTAGAVAKARAEIEAQYLMALKRQRSIDDVRERLIRECKRSRFAERALYRRPVGGGKYAEGLSIRFAEAAHRTMGNMIVSTLLVQDGDDQQIWRVGSVDLETNAIESEDVHVPKFVERRQIKDGDEVVGRRTNSRGDIVYRVRADQGALVTTVRAECRKAKRRCVLSLVPADVLEECEQQIRATNEQDIAQDPDAARKQLVRAFGELGVKGADLRDYLGHDLDGASPSEIAELRAIYATVREGEATWRDCLATKTGVEGDRKDDPNAALREKIANRAAAQRKGSKGKPAAPKPSAPENDYVPDAEER
jgi:hypothetical protein